MFQYVAHATKQNKTIKQTKKQKITDHASKAYNKINSFHQPNNKFHSIYKRFSVFSTAKSS